MPSTKTKLLCINDKFDQNSMKFFNKFPVAGRIYTLRLSRKEPSGRTGYLLEEVVNPYYQSPSWGMEMIEPSFDSNRFITLDDQDLLEYEEAEKELENNSAY